MSSEGYPAYILNGHPFHEGYPEQYPAYVFNGHPFYEGYPKQQQVGHYPRPRADCLPKGQLILRVVKARGIADRRRTKMLESPSCDPEWNMTLTLPVKTPDVNMKPEDSELVILLFKRSAKVYKTSPKYIGGLRFQNLGFWVESFGDKATVSEQWYPLYMGKDREQKGEILLHLEFTQTYESGDGSMNSANSVAWSRIGGSHHNDSPNDSRSDFNTIVSVSALGLAAAQVALAIAALAVAIVL